MESRRMRPASFAGAGLVLTALLMMLGGCTSSGSAGLGGNPDGERVDAANARERDDIYEIVSFPVNEPWIRDAERIVGFRLSTRFVSSATNKGAFVPGRVFIWLYAYLPNFDGKVERKLVHVWELDHDESTGYRVTKRTITGLAYWFLMVWPKELKLNGDRIDIEIGYERVQDKRVITGSTYSLRVPEPLNPAYFQPTSRPAPRNQN